MAIKIKGGSLKRKLIILPILFLFSIVGASFYFYKIAKPDPISLLPKETSFYLRFKINPEDEQIKNLKEILNKFPYYQKFSEKIGQEFEKLKEEKPFLKNLDFTISEEIVLALISPIEERMEFPLVLILPNPDLKKLERISKDFEKAIEESKDWKIEKEIYKGRIIVKAVPIKESIIEEEKLEPSSSFINGHFLLASKPEDIKKIIDLVEDQEMTKIFKKDKLESIYSNLAYRKIKKYLPKDYLAIFYGEIDWSKVLKASEIEREKEIFSPLFASLKAALDLPFFKGKEIKEVEKLAVASTIIVEKNEMKFESHSLNLSKEAFLPSPFSFEDSLSKFVPEKIGNRKVFLYSEGRNLKSSFEEIEKDLKRRMKEKEREDFENFLKSLKEILKVNLKEEVLPLFTKNYAFLLASEDTGKETPIVSFIFEIEEEEKVKENLLKLKIPKISMEELLGLGRTRRRAKDARIIADMMQMRTMAEIIYDDYGNYRNVNCNFRDIKTLCDDIEKLVGEKPVIHSSFNGYCAFTKLNELGAYYCLDSSGKALKTYIDPKGYCTGFNFVCPKTVGLPPPEEFFPLKPEEKIGFEKEIIDGFEIYSLPIFEKIGLNFSIGEKKLIFTFDKESLIDFLKNLKDQKKLKDSQIFAKQFKEIPEKITTISFVEPYGFLGLGKNLVNFSLETIASFAGEIPEKEKISALIFELLDKGIAPYLKVLKSSASFSYSPERGLTIAKQRLKVGELSEKEKRETEQFWEKFPEWIENLESALAPPS